MAGSQIYQTNSAPERDASIVVRFAGDSGDGVQLVGQQFTQETALAGSEFSTFPDFPAEIRAPTGTTFGVSAFQIRFGSQTTLSAGDAVDILIAFNPAALKTNLGFLAAGALIIVDSHGFSERNLRKAGFTTSPIDDGSLAAYPVISADINRLTKLAVADCDVSNKEAARAKNFWALGFSLWLCGRSREASRAWITKKFSATPNLLAANHAALDAGHAYAETAELPSGVQPYQFAKAKMAPGEYRNINGTDALCLGLLAASIKADVSLLYCSYPITPASAMLSTLSAWRKHGVVTFQAEDEIAAVCAAIGASYGGQLGVTGTSGPGMALKTEAIGLAISAELPLVIVNAQRGGPSTGLPTKTEQSDLFQAVLGRNGDSPLAVIAAASPSDCYACAIEATRLAIKYRTPVILLTDGYLANAAEPWLIPDTQALPDISKDTQADAANFEAFARHPDSLARPWVAPGTVGMAHRVGGLEKADGSGEISYEPANHEKMTALRAAKIAGIAADIPQQDLALGAADDELLVLSWGSTYGAAWEAVNQARNAGQSVALASLRYLSPMPQNLGQLLAGFAQILVPEMNNGQLSLLLQGLYARPVSSLRKIAGQPFKVSEIEQAIATALDSSSSNVNAFEVQSA